MFKRLQRLTPLLLLSAMAHGQSGNSYLQTNLISDGTVNAQQTDPNLVNPWGVAIGQQTPFWINTAGTGLSEVYDGGGNKQFTVTVPAAAGGKHGFPTGIAFNSSTKDYVLKQGGAALFLFDSLDGTISGWNSSLANAQTVVDHSASGAVYTGLTIDSTGAGVFILAANLATGKLDVFDNSFSPLSLSGNFVDPALPSGYAPFNVHVLNNQVYVLYAQQTPSGGPPTPGAGAGYVSVFDTSGNYLRRAISGGKLNAPWGIALAPSSFGAFGGDLLVGNFGDGTINAYDATDFAFKGQLQDASGKIIVNDHLWEILFGVNGTGDSNTLYFSAGINDEKGGLFGSIAVAGPAAAGDFTIAPSAASLTLTKGSAGTLQIDVAPNGNFSAPVSLAVTGLPAGLTFQFAPAQITPVAGKTATSTLTISGGNYTAPTPSPNPYSAHSESSLSSGNAILSAALFPLGVAGILPFVRRRRKIVRWLTAGGGVLSLLVLALTVAGCGGSGKSSSTPVTQVPPGMSVVTVTATSGSISHTAKFSLTVE